MMKEVELEDIKIFHNTISIWKWYYTDRYYIEDTMNLLVLEYNLKHSLNSCEDENSLNNVLILTDYQSTL